VDFFTKLVQKPCACMKLFDGGFWYS